MAEASEFRQVDMLLRYDGVSSQPDWQLADKYERLPPHLTYAYHGRRLLFTVPFDSSTAPYRA